MHLNDFLVFSEKKLSEQKSLYNDKITSSLPYHLPDITSVFTYVRNGLPSLLIMTLTAVKKTSPFSSSSPIKSGVATTF